MENIVNVKEILERIKELKGFRTQISRSNKRDHFELAHTKQLRLPPSYK